MSREQPRYWFPAKRYGWGWGLPNSWQGWLVLGIWILVLMMVTPGLLMREAWLVFFGFVLLMVVVLFGVCYLKGEPPTWRRRDR